MSHAYKLRTCFREFDLYPVNKNVFFLSFMLASFCNFKELLEIKELIF